MSFIGVAGLLFLLSTPLTWILSPGWTPFLYTKTALGVLGCATYLVFNAKKPRVSRSQHIAWWHGGSWLVSSTLAAVCYMLVLKYSHTWDVTREQVHTLTPYTVSVIQNIPSKISLYGFFSPTDSAYLQIEKLFHQYQETYPSKVDFFLYDPNLHPDKVEQFNITERGPRIAISYLDERMKIQEPTEAALTQGIQQLLRHEKKVLYVLEEHCNTALLEAQTPHAYAAFLRFLSTEDISLERFSFQQALPTQKGGLPLRIPAHVQTLLLHGLSTSFQPYEEAALMDFIKRGGHLWVSVAGHTTDLNTSFFNALRLKIHPHTLVDTNPVSKIVGLSPTTVTLVPGQYPHTLLEPVTRPAVFSNSTFIDTVPPTVTSQGMRVFPLLKAAPTTYTSLEHAPPYTRNTENAPKDLWTAYAVEWHVPDNVSQQMSGTGKAVVLASSDFLQDRYIKLHSNTDFVLHSLDWVLSHQDETLLRPRTRKSVSLALTENALHTLNIVTMDVVPLSIACIGVYVFLRRKKRI
jgi:hypothetical protein